MFSEQLAGAKVKGHDLEGNAVDGALAGDAMVNGGTVALVVQDETHMLKCCTLATLQFIPQTQVAEEKVQPEEPVPITPPKPGLIKVRIINADIMDWYNTHRNAEYWVYDTRNDPGEHDYLLYEREAPEAPGRCIDKSHAQVVWEAGQ